MTVNVHFELVTGLVMVDGQRLAHRYSSRVLELDPYLIDIFPAKEPLQTPCRLSVCKTGPDYAALCRLDTAKQTDVLEYQHRQIVGPFCEQAQVNELLITLPHI
jgi:hypothetical protein